MSESSDRPSAESPRPDSVREYWVQADSFWHNTVPNGRDNATGTSFTPAQTSLWAIGYRAYTPNWGAPLDGDDDIGPNTGIPGPVLRAEVGDMIVVHFRNNDTHYRFPHSMHAHGVHYDPASDGAWLADDPSKPGTAVEVGESYTYTWRCPPSSVGSWPYHDHSMAQSLVLPSSTANPTGMTGGGVMELNAQLGLFGMLAITARHTAPADREFVLFFHDLYRADIPSIAQDLDCFNGYAYVDNTPTFVSKVGDRVRWRVAALGKEIHVFHTHGHRWHDGGRFRDSVTIGPSESLTVEYVEDDPGDWLYHCHVTDHMMGGMMGRLRVLP